MPPIMKSLALASPVLCFTLAFADPAVANGAADVAHIPTRMQLCQHELQSLPDEQRKAQINTCLQRRAHAEPAVERTCKSQAQAVKGESARQTTQLRRAAMRNCMAKALLRPYAELPGASGTQRAGNRAPARQAPAATI